MNTLKKIITILSTGIIGLYGAQTPNPSYSTGVTRPVPTISSLATYNNVPISLQTGIPDISYDLFNVPSNSGYFSLNIGMNYHPANAANDQWIGDLGTGWSLFGQGVISREILFDFDERATNGDSYLKNEFDDVYNYTIPGESGKFRFIRDITSNTFELVKLTPTTSQIQYQRSPANTSTLIVDSFTVITDKGIQYKFEIYNTSRARVVVFSYPNGGLIYGDQNYRSAFFLTSVSDENSNVLATYNYMKETTYVLGSGNSIIESVENKLNHIEVKDRGVIDLEYDRVDSSIKSDKFRLKNTSLKTAGGQFVSKYTFQTGLESFTKVDAYGVELEKTKFSYGAASYTTPQGFEINPELVVPNVLTKVQPLTGGVIQYDFDFIPFSTIEEKKHITPEEDFGNVSFAKINNPAKKYFFTVPVNNGGIFPNPPYYIAIDISAGQLANNYWSLAFYKKVGSTYQPAPISLGPAVEPNPDYPTRQLIPFLNTDAGEYYVSLLSAEPGITIPYGEVTFSAKHIMDPVEVTIQKHSKEGLPRVKKVKYFNQEASTVYADSTPAKIEEYNYDKFDAPGKSSGYYVAGGTLDGMNAVAPSMIYKNVKVSQGNNTGYTKYYFKAPDDYPLQTATNIWPNYNLTRSGLINKKEVYNFLNQKLSEDVFDYTFMEYDSPKYLVAPSTVGTNFYLKTSWVKENRVVSKNYFDSGVAETKKEVFKNINNYLPALERATSFDGTVQETTYQYALDKNNQKLIGASMKGIPLETASVVKKTASDIGKLVLKSEVKYDNTTNKFPSSTVSFDSQNSLVSEVIFNQYDAKGNLEQYTTKDGIPVSVVWGYNKTEPIAKIEGALYSQIAPYIADIVAKSDADKDDISEQSLQNALSLFRNNSNLANYQITTYVYDPLIGMKSMTPPSGIREIYKYDNANRLDQVVDENGKVLKKYKYNYKH
ncbi:hypothetical protein [Chryseobacterium paridis]|uniref:RHS repeat protein n=1 Tax=Chryseobacterium paridis TaxID=2800328 RepID=A0ABS1FYL0_9FLAO|nr:hypothetical protein [Chryseobacterium paridis]MBK1897507.1 hypothetical protein [Chryseobacterium paridis]